MVPSAEAFAEYLRCLHKGEVPKDTKQCELVFWATTEINIIIISVVP